MFTVASRAECALSPAFAPANANNDSLISVVKDFSPPPSPTATNFTDKRDGDERFLELGHNYLFELIAVACTAASEGELQVHPCN